MKKCISVVLAIIGMISVFAAASCGEEERHALQEQFMDKLQRLSLIYREDSGGADDYGVYSRERVAEGLYFRPELYRLYYRCYTIFDGSAEIATAEEVRGLFVEFDKEVYERFLNLSNWLLLLNGNMQIQKYNDATAVARDLYNEKFEADILSGNWTAWSLEDRIELENFVRDNPDFMPAEEYAKELRHLGIGISE